MSRKETNNLTFYLYYSLGRVADPETNRAMEGK